MTRVESVLGYEALDSRGRPTVACVVRCADGSEGEAMAPSGASTGRHEAVEVRDGGERYGGSGVQRAVAAVNGELASAVRGMDVLDQSALDARMREIDGRPGLDRLGANAVIALSLAAVRAAAATQRMPLYRWVAGENELLLPMPMVNILSGGLHAGGLVDIQDFLVVPLGAASFSQAIAWCVRIRAAAATEVRARGGNPDLVADEGGLAMKLAANSDGIELLTRAIERAGLRPAEDVGIAIDLAATHFHRDGTYRLSAENRSLDGRAMGEMVSDWVARWPVVSLEDPLAEDDWEGWSSLGQLRARVQVLGDDLFVTSAERLQRGIDESIANSILVKVNQNGTVTGAAEVVRQARAAGYASVVSARSGETEDSTMADLVVGWRAGQVKVGSVTRSERLAKWNRLLRIEAETGAEFAGRAALAPLAAPDGPGVRSAHGA